jgi:DNA-binding NtrC family response regulator
LILDSGQENAMAMNIALDKAGIRSGAFSDPRKTLEHFYRHSDEYSLILSDTRMPAMSEFEFEFVRRIRSERPEAKIILMTAFAIDLSEFVTFPYTKVDGFIQKPFPMSALDDTIQSIQAEA